MLSEERLQLSTQHSPLITQESLRPQKRRPIRRVRQQHHRAGGRDERAVLGAPGLLRRAALRLEVELGVGTVRQPPWILDLRPGLRANARLFLLALPRVGPLEHSVGQLGATELARDAVLDLQPAV